MATPTIFDRILSGDIPCWRVYEDEHVLAFLDVGPLAAGPHAGDPQGARGEAARALRRVGRRHRARAAAALPRPRRRHRRRGLQRAAEQRRAGPPGGLPRPLPPHPQARPRAGARHPLAGGQARRRRGRAAAGAHRRGAQCEQRASRRRRAEPLRAWEVAESFGRDKLRLVERADPEPAAGELLLRMRAGVAQLPRPDDGRGALQPAPAAAAGALLGRRRRGGRRGQRRARLRRRRPRLPDLRAALARRRARPRAPAGDARRAARRHPARAHDGRRRVGGAPAGAPRRRGGGDAALRRRHRLERARRPGAAARRRDRAACWAPAAWRSSRCRSRCCTARASIVTSSSDEKLERVREMGAWETVNYAREKAWGKRVRELAGEGVDHVVEVGGAGTLAESLRAVRMGGTIHLIGVLAGGEAPLLARAHLHAAGARAGRPRRPQGVVRGPQPRAGAAAVRPGRGRWSTASSPSTRRRRAFDHLASGAHFGKVAWLIAEPRRRGAGAARGRAAKRRTISPAGSTRVDAVDALAGLEVVLVARSPAARRA